MSTKASILKLGDQLIRDKGYNAFSFYDISKSLKVKNASIHYHFATKEDLGIEVVKAHRRNLEDLILSVKNKNPELRLKAFLSIYENTKQEDGICIVGSLATDFKTLEPKMKNELKLLANKIIDWVTETIEEGRANRVFYFEGRPRTKALLIITNMLAALQVTRLTNDKDFYTIKEAMWNDLKKK
jgi:TetR/AcrR family transcriptional regulator, transcriptional repressor for nem operon